MIGVAKTSITKLGCENSFGTVTYWAPLETQKSTIPNSRHIWDLKKLHTGWDNSAHWLYCQDTIVQWLKCRPCREENPVNKNQGWEPSIKSTRQMRTQVDTTKRKKTNDLAGSSYKSFMTEPFYINDNVWRWGRGARGDPAKSPQKFLLFPLYFYLLLEPWWIWQVLRQIALFFCKIWHLCNTDNFSFLQNSFQTFLVP